MSNFKTWINEPSTGSNGNCLDYDGFASDNQRINGFKAGDPASAQRVNSALRQANLVVAALMNVLYPDDQTMNFLSPIAAIEQRLDNLLPFTHIGSVVVKDRENNVGVFSGCIVGGQRNVASNNDQTIVGKLANANTDTVFAVGVGDDSQGTVTKKNAIEVKDNGRTYTQELHSKSVTSDGLVLGSNFDQNGNIRRLSSKSFSLSNVLNDHEINLEQIYIDAGYPKITVGSFLTIVVHFDGVPIVFNPIYVIGRLGNLPGQSMHAITYSNNGSPYGKVVEVLLTYDNNNSYVSKIKFDETSTTGGVVFPNNETIFMISGGGNYGLQN